MDMISKLRRLPIPGRVLVKRGDAVTPDTELAIAEVPGYPVPINVSTLFEIEPHELTRVLVKSTGEQVSRGEVIARKKSFFGLSENIKSPINGTVDEVCELTGVVTIVSHPIPVNLTAFVAGHVVKSLEGEGAVIESPATLIEGVFGVGGEKSGTLKVLSASPEDMLTEADITVGLKGCIVVGGSSVTLEALNKAARIGVHGIICGGIDNKVLTAYLGFDIGIPITGQESMPLTLIITEGFGHIAMREKTFALLSTMNGCLTSISGKTHIRAQSVKPEIIVAYQGDEATAPLDTEIALGTVVRIMSHPHFGDIGSIVEITQNGLQSEIITTTLRVALKEGTEVTVPLANVERYA